MKAQLLIAAAALMMAASPAPARDVSITLPPDAQQATRNLPAVFDQCIAAVSLRGDMTNCKLIGNFATALANEVAGAQAKADAEDRAKAEAVNKKAADDKKAAEDKAKPKGH